MKSVTVFSAAKTGDAHVKKDGFCGNIFSTEGACCDQDELKQRAAETKARLTLRKEKFIAQANKTAELCTEAKLESMIKFMTDNKASISGKAKIPGASVHFRADASATISDADITAWTAVLTKLKATVAKRKEIATKVASEADKCYAVLNEVRDRALCLRCSGAADKYFTNGNAYKVKSNFCLGFIAKCSNYVAYVKMMQSFLSIEANIKAALKGSLNNDEKTGSAAISTEASIDAWIKCADSPSSCHSSTEIKTKCNEMWLSSENYEIEGDLTVAYAGEAAAKATISSTVTTITSALFVAVTFVMPSLKAETETKIKAYGGTTARRLLAALNAYRARILAAVESDQEGKAEADDTDGADMKQYSSDGNAEGSAGVFIGDSGSPLVYGGLAMVLFAVSSIMF